MHGLMPCSGRSRSIPRLTCPSCLKASRWPEVGAGCVQRSSSEMGDDWSCLWPTPIQTLVSDLLICGILMWHRVRGFGFAGERVDKSQAGARIGELGRVEMFQQ